MWLRGRYWQDQGTERIDQRGGIIKIVKKNVEIESKSSLLWSLNYEDYMKRREEGRKKDGGAEVRGGFNGLPLGWSLVSFVCVCYISALEQPLVGHAIVRCFCWAIYS